MTDELGDAFRVLLASSDERTQIATAAYDALVATGQLSSHKVLTYRCRNAKRRCVLLEVLLFPQGVVLHVPRYKLSPELNASSSTESGRANNTEDGDRRWRARTFFAVDADRLGLSCDHFQTEIITEEQIAADLEAGALEVTLPR